MTLMSTQDRPCCCRQGGQCFRPGRHGLARTALAALAVAGLWLWASPFAAAQPVTFDFDSGTPTLAPYQNLPKDQTAGGITARFSAVDARYNFSIQTDVTTGWNLSQFSGNYLYPNSTRGSALRIQFSHELTEIGLTFATTDYPLSHPTPTPIVLTALSATPTGTNVVGSATARATYGGDKFPMGTLAYSFASRMFNRVEVRIQAGGDATFLVDNVTVATIPELDIWAADSNTVVVYWPAPSTGFVLQQNSTPDTTNWVSVTNPVEVVDGQNQVTVSPAPGNGFYRLFHP